MVTVPVVRTFIFQDRLVQRGEHLTVSPVQAAVLHFQGVVSLLEPVSARTETPAPAAPTVLAQATTARQVATKKPARKRSSTYQRRDLTATA